MMRRNELPVTLPKVIYPLVALVEVIIEHRVKEIISGIAKRVDKFHSPLALLHLPRGVASESYNPINPFDPGEKRSIPFINETSIESLVKINTNPETDNLAKLLKGVVYCGEYVVVL